MPLTEHRSDSRLSNRLTAVASLVPPCRRLLDIGTDHAWLPISLISHQHCQTAIAIDIRKGPLAIASRNIKAAGLADKIEILQSDGLNSLELQPDDVVVIAGMGGYEMMDILGDQPRQCRAIVLQPMKSLPELRLWLGRHGYLIDEETLADEEHRHYTIIRCHYDGQPYEMTLLQAQVGPILLERQPPGFAGHLHRLLIRLEKQKQSQPELAVVIAGIRELQMRHDTSSNQEGST